MRIGLKNAVALAVRRHDLVGNLERGGVRREQLVLRVFVLLGLRWGRLGREREREREEQRRKETLHLAIG